MKYAIAGSAVIPLRPEPSEKAEMLTEIMFGEHVEILETTGNWAKVYNIYDGYEGWIDNKTLVEISENYFTEFKLKTNPYVLTDLFGYALNESKSPYLLPAGSTLPEFNEKDLGFKIGPKHFSLICQPVFRGNSKREIIISSAKAFLNSPYLWGGKNPFGIDCSGLSQVCYKIAGIPIPRDAGQQVKSGIPVSFLENSLPGDLAFFDNEEGNIIHVGILLSPDRIIHSSGKVHIDNIDHQGIYNTELKKYTHKLRVVINVTGV